MCIISQRFTQDEENKYMKINHFTTFEAEMDLQEFIFEGVNTHTKYELAGIICHLNAGFGNGHYIALSKRTDRCTSHK